MFDMIEAIIGQTQTILDAISFEETTIHTKSW